MSDGKWRHVSVSTSTSRQPQVSQVTGPRASGAGSHCVIMALSRASDTCPGDVEAGTVPSRDQLEATPVRATDCESSDRSRIGCVTVTARDMATPRAAAR